MRRTPASAAARASRTLPSTLTSTSPAGSRIEAATDACAAGGTPPVAASRQHVAQRRPVPDVGGDDAHALRQRPVLPGSHDVEPHRRPAPGHQPREHGGCR